MWGQTIKFWIPSRRADTHEIKESCFIFYENHVIWLYVFLIFAQNSHWRLSVQCLHCSWCPPYPGIFFLWGGFLLWNRRKVASTRLGESSEWQIPTRSGWSFQKLCLCAPSANPWKCVEQTLHIFCFPNLHEELKNYLFHNLQLIFHPIYGHSAISH